MSVQDTETSVVTSGSTTTDAMSQFFSIGTTNDPAYLIVNALDRNEYTSAGNGDTGDFSGNGATLDLSSIGQDGRGAGIVFTWQASSHSYVNATYGAFSSLDFTSSDCSNDVTNISLFTTTNLSLANACANNAYGLIQQDAAGYAGSVTFANDPNFSGTVPAQATPDGIAAAAMSFVGDAWNEEGCWVLASTIAAEAGAGLPVQSTSIGTPGKPNGEWVTVYNGPSGGSANWQSLVSTGDIVVFTPAGGGGHITTCVSGSGTTAMLVDNITYEGSNGKISNLANDGSSSDIIVSAPHLASQEWNGVSSGSVVIYALDTPVVTDIKSTASVTANGTLSLSSLFSVKDTGGKPITQYQVYNSVSGDSILLNGKVQSGVSSSAPLSATSLTTLGLLAGGSAATDTLEIRAFNGTYWGDWQSLGVNVTVPVPLPPVLESKTAAQNWKQGQAVSLSLGTSLFKDPQGQVLTYSAAGAAGTSLPSWLSFNAAKDSFSGTVPSGLASFSVTVTATDTAGLSSSETFAVNVAALAPTIAVKTPNQSVAAGSSVNLSLPTGTFVDPQGENLTFTATLAGGAPLPNSLQFNASSLSFSGTAPTTTAALHLVVTATDTSNLSVADAFTLTIAKAAGGIMGISDWHDTVPAVQLSGHGGALWAHVMADMHDPAVVFVAPTHS